MQRSCRQGKRIFLFNEIWQKTPLRTQWRRSADNIGRGRPLPPRGSRGSTRQKFVQSFSQNPAFLFVLGKKMCFSPAQEDQRYDLLPIIGCLRYSPDLQPQILGGQLTLWPLGSTANPIASVYRRIFCCLKCMFIAPNPVTPLLHIL